MANESSYRVLRRAKVVDKLREVGLSPDSMTWRRLDGRKIEALTGLRNGDYENGHILYPVEKLTRLLLEELGKQPSATVYWNHKVLSVGQDESSAWVDVENGARLKADFVVGCDGATSSVRKALFGSSFPGKTWDKIMVGINVSQLLSTGPHLKFTCAGILRL
jgi:2-polyprenyl-6-methoxyphenol hydroxylase-like FAD-dependent oxidoreductase